MKLMYKGTEIATIITNHSMTISEALYAHGIDIDSQDDCRAAYENDEEYAYIDDCGNYCIDTEYMSLEG